MTRPAITVFHRWRFNTLNDYITNGPTAINSNGLAYIDVTKAGPEHEYHMRRLVELGVIAKIEFTLTNAVGKSPERSNFFRKLLANDCPKYLYWSSVEPTTPTPTVVDVWCEIENKEDWISFLETENKLAETSPEQNIAPKWPVGGP
jgi:hypothetical protein